jgi:branched-chain amino acid transport system ATP-binding protein
MKEILKITNLNVHYGLIHAIKDVSIEIHSGEIVTLIGANGAGKTTILKTISGLLSQTNGDIFYNNIKINNLAPHLRVIAVISHSPEGRGIFPNLSTLDNLLLGAYLEKNKTKIEENLNIVYKLFPILHERKNQNAGTLSGGEQQMLAIGRALMLSPKLILLDEPSLGLAPQLVHLIFKIIKDINAQGTSILLVEQNAHMALKIAHKGYVLETGKIAMEGFCNDLLLSEDVKRAYLG